MNESRVKEIFNLDPFTLTKKAWHHVVLKVGDKWIETIGYGYRDDWAFSGVSVVEGGSIKFGPEVRQLLEQNMLLAQTTGFTKKRS